MLDIKFVRENPSLVQKAATSKNVAVNIDHVLEIDRKIKELSGDVQLLREQRNKIAKEKNIEEGRRIKLELDKKEPVLKALENELKDYLSRIPNLPKTDVKVGKDESDNDLIKKVGEPRRFDFPAKDHLELGESLDVIDVKSAAKVSGARFAYLKNEAALLEFALIQLAMEILVKEGFTPVVPPALIRKDITQGLGYWQNKGNEDYFWVHSGEEDEGYYLVGTAEHSIVPMFTDETLQLKELPKRIVAFSSAFRREAGTYGKDTRGIFRVHQFDKVEMVSLVKEGEDDKEQDFLLSLEEKLFQLLEIPYQVVKMATGDLGFPAARKFDIEAWIPSQNKYREVTSVSTVTDFQSRRLNIKYQDGQGKKYVSILNGTAFAIGRTLISILENHQQKDGSVEIPKALHRYLNFTKISRK